MQNNAAADPTYSTATYPSTTTINQILYSSANNTVSQITAGIDGVLITSHTGVPSLLANSGTPGFILTANAGAPPSWQAAAAPYISLSPYIVGTDAHSGFATIQAAINQAVADGATATTPQNVYIKPKADGSVYSENLTFATGVNLIAFPAYQQLGISSLFSGSYTQTPRSVEVDGAHTIPSGATLRFDGLVIGGNITSTNATVYFNNCYLFNGAATAYLRLVTGGTIYFNNCIVKSPANNLSFANDSSTYTLTIYNTDWYEASGPTLGTNQVVSYDVQNCNMVIGHIDASNAADFSFQILSSTVLNDNQAPAFTIGASTSSSTDFPGIYFNKVEWHLIGLDASFPMLVNNNAAYPITFEDCYFKAEDTIASFSSLPFPTSGATAYLNCKLGFYGAVVSAKADDLYVMNLYNSAQFQGGNFNNSIVYHGQATLQTSDATVTLIFGVPLQLGSQMASFWGTVTGSKSDFSDVLTAQFQAVGSRVGAANITILSPYINEMSTSTANITITANVGAQSIYLNVQGIVATTYNWVADFYFQYITTTS